MAKVKYAAMAVLCSLTTLKGGEDSDARWLSSVGRWGGATGKASPDSRRALGELAVGQRAPLAGERECIGGDQTVAVNG